MRLYGQGLAADMEESARLFEKGAELGERGSYGGSPSTCTDGTRGIRKIQL